MEDEEMEVWLLLLVDLYDRKAINVRTWDGWRERTMKKKSFSILAYIDGECVLSLIRDIEKWMERNRWIDRVVNSNLKPLRMKKRGGEKKWCIEGQWWVVNGKEEDRVWMDGWIKMTKNSKEGKKNRWKTKTQHVANKMKAWKGCEKVWRRKDEKWSLKKEGRMVEGMRIHSFLTIRPIVLKHNYQTDRLTDGWSTHLCVLFTCLSPLHLAE